MQGGKSGDADASLFAEAAAGFPTVPRFAGPSSAFCFPFRVTSCGSWLKIVCLRYLLPATRDSPPRLRRMSAFLFPFDQGKKSARGNGFDGGLPEVARVARHNVFRA